MSVSNEEATQYLSPEVAAEKQDICTPEHSKRISLYDTIIFLSIIVGITHIIRQMIIVGIKQSIGTIIYAVFCVFLISSKRLLEHKVGFYSGVKRFAPAGRPSWNISIIVGWILLLLPIIYWFI